MIITKKQLTCLLGDRWEDLKIPELVKSLKGLGLKVSGDMTLSQLFDAVRRYEQPPAEKTS